MARNGWHILRDEDGLTLTRHLPARFDVSAETAVPACDPGRLARQVRQDMWRAMQRVRGFSPVVRVDRVSGGLRVTAGGRLADPRTAAHVLPRIEAMLDDPALRARWLAWAGAGRAT